MATNQVNWFEIPVTEMDRAKKFYSNVFQKELTDNPMPNMEMAMFQGDMEGFGSTGALVKHPDRKPMGLGVMIYFTCKDLNNELGRVENNGGQIIYSKTAIGEHGFIAAFIDSEGNSIGLHSKE